MIGPDTTEETSSFPENRSIAHASKEVVLELNIFKQRELEEMHIKPVNLADALPAYDEEEAMERMDNILLYQNIYGSE